MVVCDKFFIQLSQLAIIIFVVLAVLWFAMIIGEGCTFRE